MIASTVPAIQSVDAESYKKTLTHVNYAVLNSLGSYSIVFTWIFFIFMMHFRFHFLKNNRTFLMDTRISKIQDEIDSLIIFRISMCFSHSSFTGSLFMFSSHNCLAMDSFQPFLHVGICKKYEILRKLWILWNIRYKSILDCFFVVVVSNYIQIVG